MRWLGFRIFHTQAEQEDVRFGIRESQGVQVLPLSDIQPVRDAPAALLGTMEFRGKVIKVFDLGAALGWGSGYLPARTRLLVARQTRASLPVAIAVQPELQEISNADSGKLRRVDLRALAKISGSRQTIPE